MKHTTVAVRKNTSTKVAIANLILSVRDTHGSHCEIVVGCPGLPNVVKDAKVGDAVLFETPDDGTYEVRALSMDYVKVELLVTQVSPRLGIGAGFADDDPNNSPFTPTEISKIAESVSKAKLDLNQRNNIAPEQLELISRKLDQIQAASERLGRKDWINYVAGTLTSMIVSAAFSPEVSKAIFQSVNSAFVWIFNNALLTIGSS